MKKHFIIFYTALIFLLPAKNFASSGLVITSAAPNTSFSNFSAPAGEYITSLVGSWVGGIGYVYAYTSAGTNGIIMETQDVQIFFSSFTVATGKHITAMGPDGAQYLSVWSEDGYSTDLIYNNGSVSNWTFTNFTVPAGEVINGFTADNSGGLARLYAQSTSVITDVNEIGDKMSFSVFPNPVSNYVTIHTSEKATIEILNFEGQIINASNIAGKETTVDIRNIPNGVYFIKAITDRGVAVRKFLKQ